ncbi:MAG: hypothetical protein AB2L24_05590 [Mangrovibacterium sp.]
MKPVLALIFSMICLLANCQETGKFSYKILSSGKSYKITPKFEKEPKGEKFGAEVESYDGEWMMQAIISIYKNSLPEEKWNKLMAQDKKRGEFILTFCHPEKYIG